MYPGKGTYIPADQYQNGMSRHPEVQAALDKQMQEFIDWKKETELAAYEAAFARYQARFGPTEIDLDTFILSEPDLSKVWF